MTLKTIRVQEVAHVDPLEHPPGVTHLKESIVAYPRVEPGMTVGIGRTPRACATAYVLNPESTIVCTLDTLMAPLQLLPEHLSACIESGRSCIIDVDEHLPVRVEVSDMAEQLTQLAAGRRTRMVRSGDASLQTLDQEIHSKANRRSWPQSRRETAAKRRRGETPGSIFYGMGDFILRNARNPASDRTYETTTSVWRSSVLDSERQNSRR